MHKLLLMFLILVVGCGKPDFVHKPPQQDKKDKQKKEENRTWYWYYFL